MHPNSRLLPENTILEKETIGSYHEFLLLWVEVEERIVGVPVPVGVDGDITRDA